MVWFFSLGENRDACIHFPAHSSASALFMYVLALGDIYSPKQVSIPVIIDFNYSWYRNLFGRVYIYIKYMIKLCWYDQHIAVYSRIPSFTLYIDLIHYVIVRVQPKYHSQSFVHKRAVLYHFD